MSNKATNQPTLIVILGVTGDLAARTIFRSLWNLHQTQQLQPLTRIIGVARRPWSNAELHHHIAASLQAAGVHTSLSELSSFLSLFSYTQEEFTQTSPYSRLGQAMTEQENNWGQAANKLFYLAVPPQLYPSILSALGHSRGIRTPNHWTRLMIEKPIGDRLTTARALEAQLHALFDDKAIFRVDHYLAKPGIASLLKLRSTFTAPWDHTTFSRIEIRLLETLDVANRADTYDSLGAVRDTIQNHILEALATVLAAEPPQGTLWPQARAQALVRLQPDYDTITRSQYQGYQEHKGVSPHSQTETYARIIAHSTDPRWSHVPLVLETGKAMPQVTKDIRLFLLAPLGPEKTQEIALPFETNADSQESHTKLISDCLRGDQTLFVSHEEVLAAWKFTDTITTYWEQEASPLHSYPAGTQP